VYGEAGHWSESGGDRRYASRIAASVTTAVYRGVPPSRYFILAAMLSAIDLVFEVATQAIFLMQRHSGE